MQSQYQFAIDSLTGQSRDDAADFGLEMHAISSSCKPVAGWLARDGIQECREACAGHGYLKGKQLFWLNLIITKNIFTLSLLLLKL